ncbi:KR-domain-containing protein [Aspergillus sclerotiicarbonarius CBS 121057]|uniref:KR-domain-containing protein n=1 Tax=Aspergillus sclerotiicarbonarius (strain CBS 121057 / IBT 28362) TaxID=1448318 RepID=A0A319EUI2_ASPSB|nr:KR-domain-containing protein [Aspergillus sclerotiicarbonarius CBS 121057]
MNDFETMVHKDLDVPNTYHATGKASAILANRVSWFYNLKGPSIAINTACSGSLVALHLAWSLHFNGNGFSSQGATKLLVWSAADEKTVARTGEDYKTHLLNHDDEGKASDYLEALAFTLSQRRSHLSWRSFCISNTDQRLGNLDISPAVQVNSKLQVCFVFTGQGAQWAAMGQELLEYDVFRRSLEESDMLLRNIGCQFSILEKLYRDKGPELDRPEFCQPSCTALQVALVELLADWGVRPFAVVGHSSGEVAAAYCAGIITKSHALQLAFFRGVAVSASSQMNSHDGGMMAVRLSPDKCEAMLTALAQSQKTRHAISVAFLGITQGGQIEIPTIVPTEIHDMWLSTDISREVMSRVSARSIQSSARTHDVDYILTGTENKKQLLLGDLTLTSIEKVAAPVVTDTKEAAISLYHVEWKPDVNLLSPQSDLFAVHPSQVPRDESERIRLTEYACFLAMSGVLSAIGSGLSTDLQCPEHLQKYVAWMRHQIELLNASADWSEWISVPPAGAESQEQLWEIVSSFGPEGNLIVKLCRQLLPIVKGEVDPLQILFADETLADYYRLENPPREVIEGVQNMQVVEIGAGTGGMTKYILDSIGEVQDGGEARFAQYVFTDISPAFFKAAKEKFGRSDRIVWKTLDIERTPADQGFEVEAYDLVIASNVLHATKDLSLTLGNARKLLKPGGKLILVEGTSPNLLRTSFIFGCLPGWWLSTESYREWGPLVSAYRWDELLRENHFTGADLILDGADKMNSLSSAVITAACPLIQPNGEMSSTSSDVLIVRTEKSALQQSLATAIHESCQGTQLSTRTIDASEMQQHLTGATVVFLQTVDEFIFHDLDEEGYQSLKKATGMAKNLLWVTRRCSSPGSGSFEQDAVLGLARSLMSETEGLNIVTLGLEDVETSSRAAQHIWAVLQHYFGANTFPPLNSHGEEIFEIDGCLCLSRVLSAKAIADEIWATRQSKPVMILDNSTLENDQVEIQIQGAAILPTSIPGQPSWGHEVYGVLTQVGSDVQKSFQIGNAVVAIIPNPNRTASKTRVQCSAGLVHRVPNSLDNNEALVLPLDFMIAYDTLHNCARLRAGESILICQASSALGQAAIQLAQYLGAEVFVGLNTKDGEAVADRYRIPVSHRLSQQGIRLTAEIKRLTGGRGVDVLFTPLLNREAAQPLWDCMKAYGRIIEVNTQGASSGAVPLLPRSFKQNIMFARVDIPELFQAPDRLATLLPEIMHLIEQKAIVPLLPLHILTPSEFEKLGGSDVDNETQSGKVILSFDLDVTPASKPPLFDSASTYLIAGGLGGLGKSIAKWMISHGARNLVLLGRQGAESPGANSFLEECAAMNVSIFTPKCDIGDDKAVSSVIQEAQRLMPPIKGCIQASMVLKSAMFAKMTLDQWTETLRSKVQGSYNLDRHLPTQLDFFIFLSSVCGIIGASGQSNYAFGCAYQDALARSKVTMRQKAVSIDLGIVEGVGYTAEHQGVGSFMRSLGLQPIPEDYLLSMLEYYCDPGCRIHHPSDAQVVAGIMTQEEMQRSGLVRSRFYSRPLWKHLRQRAKPIVNRSAIARRPAGKAPAPEVTVTVTEDTLPSSLENESPISVSRAICERLSEVLAISAEDIDPAKPLHMYGVDSLVAMEMRGWFKEALQKDVAVFDIMSNRPIEVLAQEVVGVAG